MNEDTLYKKKIIITVTNPIFHDRRMLRFADVLKESGAEVLIVGVDREKVPKPDNINHNYKLFSIASQRGILFYALYNIQLFFFLLTKSFDLLISVDLDSLLAGYFAVGIKGKKRIYDAHEYFTEVPELKGKVFVKGIWSLIAKMCIGKNNLTVSESLAEVLSKKYKKPFEVVRNLPQETTTALKVKELPKEGPIQLLYIGYLNEGRGLEVLVESMKSLPDRFILTLAGSGDIESELKKQIQSLHLQDWVHITGWLPPSELKPHLEKAHLGFNLLEKRSLSYYYSLANKTFDYIQYGIPAFHMAFPEYKKLNDRLNGFFLLEELEVTQLVELIENISKDPRSYKEKSENNLNVASQFKWEIEKGILLDFVTSIFYLKKR